MTRRLYIETLKQNGFSLAVLSISIILYLVAGRIEFDVTPGRLGPDFWPKLILLLLVFFTVVDLISKLKGSLPDKKDLHLQQEVAATAAPAIDELDAELTSNEEGTEQSDAKFPMLLAAGMAITIGYAVAVELLGFILTTFIYMVAFMYIGRYRSHRVIWAGSLFGTLAMILLFNKLVYVSLPIGTAPFDQITIAIYYLFGIE